MLKVLVIFILLQNPESLLKDAKNLVKEGKYKVAKEMYEEALKSQKIHPLQRYRLLIELADVEMEYLDMYEDALKNLLLAKSLFRENAHFQDEVFYRLGVLYEKMGNYKKAAEFYQIVVTKFRKSKYWQDAFDAVERCFRKNVPEYVAKIGETYITLPEFEKIVENVPPFARPKTKKEKANFLDRIIERKILALEAKERKMYLKSYYIEQLSQTKEDLLINTLSQEIAKEIKISPEEINKYYQEHLKEFKLPEKFKFVRIEVKEKELAQQIVERIKKGEPAESLAMKYSTAPDAKKGGRIEDYSKGSFPKEYYEYVKDMNPGEVKGPIFVKQRKIYAVIKLLNKIPEKVRPLEEVKNAIENRLKATKRREKWQSLIEELKKKYKPENYLLKEK